MVSGGGVEGRLAANVSTQGHVHAAPEITESALNPEPEDQGGDPKS